MANNLHLRPPRVRADHGIDMYESIDNVDADLYDGLPDNQSRNAFLDLMRWLTGNKRKGRNFPQGCRGVRVVKHWTDKREYRMGRTYTGQPAAIATRPGAAPHVPAPPVAVLPIGPAPNAPPPAVPPAPSAPIVPAGNPPVAQQPTQQQDENVETEQGNDIATSTALSEASSGERSPPFHIQNDPKGKRFLAPTVGQRQDFFNHENGRWKFAMALYQTRLDGSGADDRRFEKGTMPRKSVFLCVRTDDNGVIENQITVKCLEALNQDEINKARHEIRMNERISTLHCSHMIPYHGSSHRKSTKRFRGSSQEESSERDLYNIYTSFAELGILAHIYDGHENSEKPVSEHFIWYLLSQVTEALLALQKGACSLPNTHKRNENASIGPGDSPDPNPASETWRPVVHSDVKNANIFLRSHNSDYPAYPDIVLSDFDIAFEQDDEHEIETRKYQGTAGLRPPERDGAGMDEDSWAPDDWSVSEKSDVWSLAMTAWALMTAHKREDFYKNIQDKSEDPDHVDDLRKGNVGKKDSIFPTTVEGAPREYTVLLCQVLSRCLRYNPKYRMSLRTLQRTVDDNLAKLDRMYGDEIRKQKDTIADDFRLVYATQDHDEWALYATGQKSAPPRKRRKTKSAVAVEDSFVKLVADWNSESRYPQPNAADQDNALNLVDDLINNSSIDEIKNFRESKVYMTAWHHLYSSIRKRLSSERDVYVATGLIDEEIRRSLEPDTKRTVLMLLRDTVLDIATWSASDDEKIGIQAFLHAVEWGTVLLDNEGKLATPRLNGKTEMHRGMRSFLLGQPSGVPLLEPSDWGEED